jgi:iron(III) transport system ATP-binding protein
MRVRLEGIAQSFGSHRLFQDLTLDIPSGELFTLLGPSGCGKTTLLRMLAGFVAPDAGRILFGERDVTALPAHRRGVGMVFQDYALFPDRSILANVAYGLDARGLSSDEARERALAMLDRVGLKELAARLPGALSGGQRQRVATARALVIGPELLLLDEPLSALDVKLRVELRALVRELQQESRITTVFVTHDQEEALSLSDRIAVMDRGEIVQIGAPVEIYGAPASAFAADFIGSANVLPVERIETGERDGVVRVVVAGHALTARDAVLSAPPGAAADRLALVVRREEIGFVADGAPAGANEVAGAIEAVEFRGSVTGYRIATAVGTLYVDAWTAAAGRVRRRGEAVRVRLPEGAVVVAAGQ